MTSGYHANLSADSFSISDVGARHLKHRHAHTLPDLHFLGLGGGKIFNIQSYLEGIVGLPNGAAGSYST